MMSKSRNLLFKGISFSGSILNFRGVNSLFSRGNLLKIAIFHHKNLAKKIRISRPLPEDLGAEQRDPAPPEDMEEEILEED